MAIILDGTAGLQSPGVTDTGNLSVSGTTALSTALPITSGGTGTTSTTFANLTTNVTGTLPIANGGTNSTATPTAGGIVYGTGTAQSVTAAGTSGQVLTSAGSGAPVWASVSTPIGTDMSATNYTLTMPNAISSSTTAPVMQAVSLDGTKQLMLIGGTSSLQAVVWDGSAFGTMVLVRNGLNLGAIDSCAVVAISSTSVLVSSLVIGTTSLQTVVLSISGTTITVNTAVTTTLAANSQFVAANTRFVVCGSSYVLNYFISATGLPAFIAITVSGTTPTLGAELALSFGTSIQHAYAYTSSVLLSLSRNAGTNGIYAQPISVSGTTLTAGTSAIATTTSADTFVSGVLSSGRVAIAYPTSTSTQISCSVISVTGTVASISTAATTLTVGTINPVMQVYGSQAFVLTGTASGDTIGLLTDTAGVATVGTPLTVSGGASRMVGYLSSGKVFLANTGSSSSFYVQYGISGSTVVVEKTFPTVIPSIVATFSTQPYYTQPLSGPAVSGTSGSQSCALRTSAGKTAIASSNSTIFTISIDGAYAAKVQENPNYITNITYNDGISTAIGWAIPALAIANTTTLVLRKMVLS